MYGLAAHEEQDENSDRWLGIAAGITNTCHESYYRTDTKLGPEAFRFTDAVEARAVKQNERYYILRLSIVAFIRLKGAASFRQRAILPIA